MRIGLITHTFTPEFIGGREIHVESLAKVLGKSDDVFVFTGGNTKNVIKEYRDGYILYKIPSYPFLLSDNPLQVYRIVPGIIKTMIGENLDIIHAHEYGHFTSDISALYSKLTNKPFVLTIHGYIINDKLKFFKRIYDKTFGKFALTAAKKIITTSESLKIEIVNTYHINDVIIIPNGIFLNQYRCQDIRQKNLIISAGRILPRKGFSYLIDAAEEILRYYPEMKIVIIGPDGGDEKNIRTKIKEKKLTENVILKGLVSDEVLKNLLSISSLFVIPSLYEPFGIVALEAMASGCPVVSTNVGGLSKIIDHEKTGLLVPPANKKALAHSIIALLENKHLAKKLAINAKEKVKEFDWENVGKATKKVYEDILSIQI